MKLVFGAPVALLAPYVGYMLTWIVAWIYNSAPGVAVQYWPPGLFCVRNTQLEIFCGRSPTDLTMFIITAFFACCLIGWESVRILLPAPGDPDQIAKRESALAPFVRAMAWGIVVLPTLVIGPHIYNTLQSVPGAFSSYGWGTETMVDFIRMWVAGAMTMFLYGILRNASLNN